MHNLLLSSHTLCLSYVIKHFYLLVPRSVVNNCCVLCTVKAKNENKNIQQRTLSILAIKGFEI